MTREEVINMLKAKRDCAKRETSGVDEMCNNGRCVDCPLNYEQGNMGEQKEALDMAIKALDQQPCDCISRAELLKAVDTWDKFGCDADTKLVPVKDCYVPYIHYDDVLKAIKGMPSIQPKTGHWIVYEDCEGKTRRCVCDRCGHETGDYTWKNPNFCEECGAKMVEPQESEE